MTAATPIPPRSRTAEIQALVAAHCGLPVTAMRAKNRRRAVARPRQIAMYLCRELLGMSLSEIGRLFGGRDHTTVLHGCRAVEGLVLIDPDFRAVVEYLRALAGSKIAA